MYGGPLLGVRVKPEERRPRGLGFRKSQELAISIGIARDGRKDWASAYAPTGPALKLTSKDFDPMSSVSTVIYQVTTKARGWLLVMATNYRTGLKVLVRNFVNLFDTSTAQLSELSPSGDSPCLQ
jgi:hypothetical protein